MAKTTDVVLDPELSFEAAARHWRRCKTCRRAGMERARLENLCARGRGLMRDWDDAERIYESTEEAA